MEVKVQMRKTCVCGPALLWGHKSVLHIHIMETRPLYGDNKLIPITQMITFEGEDVF